MFPTEITNLVGKKYAFKVSIDEVNAKKLLPVFTVLRLTDDADILNSVVAIATPSKVGIPRIVSYNEHSIIHHVVVFKTCLLCRIPM